MNIADIADALDGAVRQGAVVDHPEGPQCAAFSDAVLNRMARDLRLAAAERLETDEFAVRTEQRPGQEPR